LVATTAVMKVVNLVAQMAVSLVDWKVALKVVN